MNAEEAAEVRGGIADDIETIEEAMTLVREMPEGIGTMDEAVEVHEALDRLRVKLVQQLYEVSASAPARSGGPGPSAEEGPGR